MAGGGLEFRFRESQLAGEEFLVVFAELRSGPAECPGGLAEDVGGAGVGEGGGEFGVLNIDEEAAGAEVGVLEGVGDFEDFAEGEVALLAAFEDLIGGVGCGPGGDEVADVVAVIEAVLVVGVDLIDEVAGHPFGGHPGDEQGPLLGRDAGDNAPAVFALEGLAWVDEEVAAALSTMHGAVREVAADEAGVGGGAGLGGDVDVLALAGGVAVLERAHAAEGGIDGGDLVGLVAVGAHGRCLRLAGDVE